MFLNSHSNEHWETVKRIFRYLQKTKDYGLRFKSSGNLKVTGFCDADWGGCLVTRRSTSGYTFLLGGAAVSWSSKQQASVAMSSCEAEYLAASHAAKEALWEATFLKELGLSTGEGVTIQCDSQSALKLMKNPLYHSKTKHIDIHVHFIRELIEAGKVAFEFCPTSLQVENPLPNGVLGSKLFFCRL